ncbi:hypothetical protein IMW82_16340 [Rhodanobacter sp. B2A1Ga4]|uniref:hypothetical protein n=1 Tax=Rhodanobacter sp. B2A1Ga4 TaxID=2778647 RepID=UPI001B3686D7|nr:hypothetical protein [Rhodanobacter sp. B2A1Ga4]MBQ4856239.1 hypothetical protein [Rhodanobacter sp. B2A1Ga4]
MNDLFEGNVNLFDEQEAESQPQATATTKRKLNPKNDKDARELMTLLQIKAMSDLYKNDPLVRQDMDAQAAKEAAKALQQAKESNVKRDALGNVSGINHSVVTGVHATVKNQVELAKALQAETYKRHGIQ